MDLDFIRAEIARLRAQVRYQRRDIQTLSKAGLSTASAEELLARMEARIDDLCEARDRKKGELKIAGAR